MGAVNGSCPSGPHGSELEVKCIVAGRSLLPSLGRQRRLCRQARKPVSSKIQVKIKVLGLLKSGSPVKMYLSRETDFIGQLKSWGLMRSQSWHSRQRHPSVTVVSTCRLFIKYQCFSQHTNNTVYPSCTSCRSTYESSMLKKIQPGGDQDESRLCHEVFLAWLASTGNK